MTRLGLKRLTSLLSIAALSLTASAQETSKPESLNMKLVGYHDLQARTAYQPTIQKQGDRWIAYIGHHGDNKHPARGSAPRRRRPWPGWFGASLRPDAGLP